MGQTMISQNDGIAALALYKEALKLVPDEPMTIFNMFKARRSMCDWEGWSDLEVPRMITMTKNDLYGSYEMSSENLRVKKLGKRRQTSIQKVRGSRRQRKGREINYNDAIRCDTTSRLS